MKHNFSSIIAIIKWFYENNCIFCNINHFAAAQDDQISQLNEVTQSQAVHIQNLIQENSKLNTTLLPEVTEKKTWWRFW
jgi:hypothetical protein